MIISKCPTCRESIFSFQETHVCRPAWDCFAHDGEKFDPAECTDKWTIFADSAREAAEKFWEAECARSGDYVSGLVIVRRQGEGPHDYETYHVETEPSVTYYASKKED